MTRGMLTATAPVTKLARRPRPRVRYQRLPGRKTNGGCITISSTKAAAMVPSITQTGVLANSASRRPAVTGEGGGGDVTSSVCAAAARRRAALKVDWGDPLLALMLRL